MCCEAFMDLTFVVKIQKNKIKRKRGDTSSSGSMYSNNSDTSSSSGDKNVN